MLPNGDSQDRDEPLSEEDLAELEAVAEDMRRKARSAPSSAGPGQPSRSRSGRASQAGTGCYLKVVAGPDAGKEFPLPASGALRVGRAPDVEAQLNDNRVSRYHLRVNVEARRVTVVDLGSKTGTLLNSRRLETERPLLTGDLLMAGDTQLQLTSDILNDTTDSLPALKKAPAPAAAPPSGTKRPRTSAPPSTLSSPPAQGSAAQALASLVNTTLGYFTLGPILGVGKSGVVFRALDTRDRNPVALKVFVPDFSRSEEDVQRFIRAAKTIMPLRNLHLVDFYNAGRQGGSCWVSMELIEGPSIAWHVQQAARNLGDWKVGLHVLRDVTRALVFLHSKKVLHRNLTPENLMECAADGLVKVADLITAKAQEGKLAVDVTAQGHLVGNLRYLAPERTFDATAAGDERSDLYSLGAVVYAVLTGRPPLEGKNAVDAIDKVRHHVPASPRQAQPAIPSALEAVVMRLLAKDPEGRFDSAKELLRHLVDNRLMD